MTKIKQKSKEDLRDKMPSIGPVFSDEELARARQKALERELGRLQFMKNYQQREDVSGAPDEKYAVTEISTLNPDLPDTEVSFLEVDQINVNPYQPRSKINEKETAFLELADSIAKNGILQPLAVAETPAGYHLIAGERRWRAAKKVGLKKIPVHIMPTSPNEMLEWALLENIQRQDLAPLEKAQAMSELKQRYGLTNKDLGMKISKSADDVRKNLSLLDLPDPIKDGLNKKLINEYEARQLAQIKNPVDAITCYQRLLQSETMSIAEKGDLIYQYQQKSQKQRAGLKNEEELVAEMERILDRNRRLTDELQKKYASTANFSLKERKTSSQVMIYLRGEPNERRQDLEKILEALGLDAKKELED